MDELLRRDLAAEGAFPWSAGRRLVWGDFRGPPPTDGREGAKTWHALLSVWRCRGTTFEFRTAAAFLPRQSWVKPTIVGDSAESRRALGHEQTHFDLSEVHARRMREYFSRLADPCRKSDDDLRALARRFVQDEKTEQHRYDDETDHGLIHDRQAAWSRAVTRQLAALSRYGS